MTLHMNDPFTAAINALNASNEISAYKAKVKICEARIEEVRDAGEELLWCLQYPDKCTTKEVNAAIANWLATTTGTDGK